MSVPLASPIFLPSVDDLRSSLAKSSLRDFIHEAWDLVEPTTELEWNWHLDEICSILEAITRGDEKRVIINIPPGFSKSLFVSVFWPAWEWTRDPSLSYLTASYSDDNTIRDNRRLRSIVTSEWYQSRFGPNGSQTPSGSTGVKLSSDQAAKIRFDTTAKGWRIASSVGGVGTGEHPDRIIIDDPLKASSRAAEPDRKACIDWADNTLSTRIARNPAIVLIMQRLHRDDLSAHFLAKGGWTHVAFPMRFQTPYQDDKGIWQGGLDCECHKRRPDPRDHRTEQGQLLWPKLWPEWKVRREEIDLGPFGAAGQLGQKPIPEGGGLFKREWFPIVDIVPTDVDRCRGWDIAESDPSIGETGDWTVGVKLARSRGADGLIYVEHVERAQRTLVDSLIQSIAESDGRKCKIREGAGSGKAVTKARSILLAGYDYAVSPESDSKVERANPFRAQCEMGNVRLLRGQWNEAYLDVMTSFPVGKYDDDVDATSNAFNELVGMRKGKRRLSWG
jgi:predicted phage terminase large subunit-like protein